MLETVLPLSLSVRLGISSGSGYELEDIHSDFCCYSFAKYDTSTERRGSFRNLRIDPGPEGLWSLTLPLTAGMRASRM